MKSYLNLIILCTLCSVPVFSQGFIHHGNTITYRGNVFEMDSPTDTIPYIDSATGNEYIKIIHYDTMAVKMNGKKIYAHTQLSSEPRALAGSDALELFIFKRIAGELEQMADGSYELDMSIVTDPKGKLVFYYYNGMYYNDHHNGKTNSQYLSPAMTAAITKKLPAILGDPPAMLPGRKKGSNEAVCAATYLSHYRAEVKQHKAVFAKQ